MSKRHQRRQAARVCVRCGHPAASHAQGAYGCTHRTNNRMCPCPEFVPRSIRETRDQRRKQPGARMSRVLAFLAQNERARLALSVPRAGKKIPCPLTPAELARLPLATVAEEQGVSTATVSRWRREAGIRLGGGRR